MKAAVKADRLGTEASLSKCLDQRLPITGLGRDGDTGGVGDACNVGLYQQSTTQLRKLLGS